MEERPGNEEGSLGPLFILDEASASAAGDRAQAAVYFQPGAVPGERHPAKARHGDPPGEQAVAG